MSTPSLLLVPARLKAGTLFSQIPTNGSGDFTVVQAVGNATRYNSSGFVESAKTNLALQSENFGTTWSLTNLLPFGSGSVLNTTATLDPYGTNVADLIVANTVSGTQHRVDQTTVSVSGSYTFSVFLKTAGYNFGRLRIGSAGVTFNLVSGTISSSDVSIIASIQSYGNGWYRCIISKAASSANEIVRINMLPTATFADFAGDGTSGIYVFGAQYEEGSSASEYIPTTTVARTRFAEVTVNGTSIANVPRLDYYTSNGTPGCPGLLVEASGTNLAFHSANWTSNWDGGSASGTTVITNSAISLAPDGTATANEIYPTSGNTNHVRTSNSTTAVTYVSGTVYTQSAFFKAGIGVGIQVQLQGPAARFTQSGYANFDLINGLVFVVSGTTADTNRAARIENYGNGWYRCSYTATCTSAGTGVGFAATLIAASGDTRLPSFSGTVTNYLLGWGAQLETGSIATSYIPTTTAQRTRNSDVISASGGVSGSIGQTEGSIYVEVDIQKLLGTTQRAFIDIGQTNNRLFLGYGNGITNQIRFLLQTSDGGLVDFQSAATTTGIIRIAVGYKNNDSAMYVNGVSVSPLSNGSFTATLTTLSNIYLGSSLSAADFLNDKINAVALYGTRLSNDALMLLSMQGNDAYLPQAIWNFYEDSRAGNTEVPTCLYTRHADIIDV